MVLGGVLKSVCRVLLRGRVRVTHENLRGERDPETRGRATPTRAATESESEL